MSEKDVFAELPEHDELLEEIASTDVVNAEWDLLRKIVKHKIDKNISQYLAEGPPEGSSSSSPPVSSPRQMPNGGLKLPPFPPRPRNANNPHEAPKNILTEAEASEFKNLLYEQLDGFEGNPPFTIQRICELCLRPQQQYRYLGKYLRAFERILLVTSSWDAFPATADGDTSRPMTSSIATGSASSTPSTPMFSPIPFLHGDARRSQSRSPPPSPLALQALKNGGDAVATPHAGTEEAEQAEQRALGLVDELDDPSPGHLSDHPHALSSTTTVTPNSKPLFGSLEQRFVRSTPESSRSSEQSTAEGSSTGEAPMALDDPEDKENKAG